MTVRQLIALLQECPATLPVGVCSDSLPQDVERIVTVTEVEQLNQVVIFTTGAAA